MSTAVVHRISPKMKTKLDRTAWLIGMARYMAVITIMVESLLGIVSFAGKLRFDGNVVNVEFECVSSIMT